MTMKNKGWLSGLFLALLAGVAIAARMYFITNLMEDVGISEEIYNAARVSADKIHISDIMTDGVNIKSLYVCSLYAAFTLFGNFTVAGVYLNMVYQVIAVLFVFVAVKNVSNRCIGVAAGLVAALLPVYVRQVAQVTSLDLAIALGALLLVVVTGILRVIVMHVRAKKFKIADEGNVQEESELPAEQAAVVEEIELKPVADASMKEILPGDLETEYARSAGGEQPEEKKINYIENPLPVPKRRAHKEMDYAVKPDSDEDDYDIKDMSGMDYFDIE